MASGVRAHFGTSLNDLAIRALLIHTTEQSDINVREVGWGRAAQDLKSIILCENNEIRVVYQGEISSAEVRSRRDTHAGRQHLRNGEP